MPLIRPIYRAGDFQGFSLLLGGEWSPAQPYQVLMLAWIETRGERNG